MEQRVSMIGLAVADLERARGFYQDILGWHAAEGPPGIVFFDLGGLVLSLYPGEDLARDTGRATTTPAPGGQRGISLAHNVADAAAVDAVFERLRTAGADIVVAPARAAWGGYSGTFADPDGHLWEIAHNPFWHLAADGRVSMTPDTG